jgi:methylglutaconyl-CoA hydratase
MNPAYTTLKLEVDGLVATVTLDRPELRNAFNEVSIAELTSVFTSLDTSKDIGVIVLTASGASFCAGADLTWMKAMAGYSYEQNLVDARLLAKMFETMYRCQKPIIAKVQGDAYGGGVGLAAVCDIVVASEAVSFCLSEARLGLMPATISPYVIKALGEQACRRYFITAEKFSAEEAHRLGFVHILSQSNQLDLHVEKICRSILQNGSSAVIACKKLVKDYANASINDVLIEDSVKRISDIRCSKEAQSRMNSFLEKN